jgi:hypothetical protein
MAQVKATKQLTDKQLERLPPPLESQHGLINMELEYPELFQLPEIHTKVCANLFSQHEQIRELSLRAGVTLKGLEKGKANLEATIAYLRGDLQEPECIHCSEKRSGPFRHCVVVKDHFGGSCTVRLILILILLFPSFPNEQSA